MAAPFRPAAVGFPQTQPEPPLLEPEYYAAMDNMGQTPVGQYGAPQQTLGGGGYMEYNDYRAQEESEDAAALDAADARKLSLSYDWTA